MIGTITLNPSIDQHIFVRRLSMDDANRADAILRFAGGKGVNVSKVVRELGGPTVAHALVGGCAGALWSDLARTDGIPFRAFPIAGETRINTILTDTAEHTQTRVSSPGPRVSRPELERFLGCLLAVRPKPAFWALGGSLTPSMPASTYRTFIHALEKKGIRCVLDADGAALERGIEATPFMIKPNEHEMQRLVGRRLSSVGQYLKAARRLVHRGVEIVVVSLGPQGALFVTAGRSLMLEPPKVPVRSKVGAGDSLIGGFVLGLYRGRPLEEAARLGIAASTSAVMKKGTKLCERRDIPKLIGRVRVRSV